MRARATKAAPVFALLEADIQRTCTDFLVAEGWRHLRTDPVSDSATLTAFRRWVMAQPALHHVSTLLLQGLSKCGRGKGFGETGMADCLYVRYCNSANPNVPVPQTNRQMYNPLSELMWIEWKRVDGKGRTTKARDDQQDWHATERRRGALTLIAGEDFPATIEGFISWYSASGLRRRVA